MHEHTKMEKNDFRMSNCPAKMLEFGEKCIYLWIEIDDQKYSLLKMFEVKEGLLGVDG